MRFFIINISYFWFTVFWTSFK